jgi:hypothetical protein
VQHGSTPLEFYDLIRDAQGSSPESSRALVGQIFLSTLDFEIFIEMMRDAKSRKLHK